MSKKKSNRIKTSKKIRRQKYLVSILLLIVLIMGSLQLKAYLDNRASDDSVYTSLMINTPMNQSLEIILYAKDKNNENKIFENETNKIEYSDIKNYREENLNRYIKYHKLYPDLYDAEVIWRVNVNLDYEFYTNTKIVSDPYDLLVIINKYNYLENDIYFDDLVLMDEKNDDFYLREEANDAYEDMKAAIKKADLKIEVTSAFEDYASQRKIYNDAVELFGKESADLLFAKPGFSEHQSGLAIDVSDGVLVSLEFSKSETYTWLLDNAHRFGFIIRYSKDEAITGFSKRPYHLRYIGKDAAIDMYESNIHLLEEYVDKNDY